MKNNLNDYEKYLKIEKLIFNKTKYGFLKKDSFLFKELIKDLNLNIQYFYNEYFKQNPYNVLNKECVKKAQIKQKAINDKINRFIKIANINKTIKVLSNNKEIIVLS